MDRARGGRDKGREGEGREDGGREGGMEREREREREGGGRESTNVLLNYKQITRHTGIYMITHIRTLNIYYIIYIAYTICVPYHKALRIPGMFFCLFVLF